MNHTLHSLLKRQLKRVYGDITDWPADTKELILAVNEAYQEFDTDRNMLERSLELSSHELLQANSDLGVVLESVLDLFLHVDRDGNILACRVGSHSDMLLKPDELIGKKIQQIPFRSVGKKFAAAIQEVYEQKTMVSIEYSLEIKGEPSIYEARLVPLRNNEIAFIIRNITEKKQLEKQQQKLQERLASAERMESLGVLAGGVAHDLNNILSPMVGYPDIIRAYMADGIDVSDFLNEINKASSQAASVIQDLLTLARRGNQKLEPFNVSTQIKEFINSASYKQIELQSESSLLLDIDESIPPAMGVPHQFSQVIMNLVMNAYEAISESGTVSITTRYALVNEHTGIYGNIPAGHYVILSVSDTGVGIADKDIKHIFEPFYSQKKMGRSGTGLGLSVVYGIIQDFKGYIDVETDLGKGTSIHVYLSSSIQPTEQDKKNTKIDGGKETLLVVDDLPGQQKLAKTVLEHWGYTVDTVSSGQEAVKYLRNSHADLVIMDMIMEEGFDGLDTYKEILSFRPDQKCIIASGFSENSRVQEALALGAGAFIYKPYRCEDLTKAVRDELDRTPIQ